MGPGPGMPVFDGLVIYAVVALVTVVCGLMIGALLRRFWVATGVGLLAGIALAAASVAIFSDRAVVEILYWHPILICLASAAVGNGIRQIKYGAKRSHRINWLAVAPSITINRYILTT